MDNHQEEKRGRACDPLIFAQGECVFMEERLFPFHVMEQWVKQVRGRSGQRVDWHYEAGRARVLALGNIEKVKDAVIDLRPELERLYQEARQRS